MSMENFRILQVFNSKILNFTFTTTSTFTVQVFKQRMSFLNYYSFPSIKSNSYFNLFIPG